jgi:hypothetical protein
MTSLEFERWYEKFASTGDICPIRLGMSRAEVRAAFGNPDDTGGTSRERQQPAIWVYGGLEFHFDHAAGDELFLIYRDTTEGVVETSISRRRTGTGHDRGTRQHHERLGGPQALRYESIEPQNLAEAENTASSGSPEELQRAIIAVALHEPNFDSALAFCRRFAEHRDRGVRGNAVLALGHLARIHRNAELAADLPTIRRALGDPDEYVRGQAVAAAGDFEMFLNLRAL